LIPIVIVPIIAIGIITQFDSPESELTDTSSPTTADTSLSGTIHIGGIFPLSGSLSNLGEDGRAGASLAITDFNEFLEESNQNWKLNMVIEDSGTSPIVAFEKLTNLKAKNIDIIIGPVTSAEVSYVKGYSSSNNMLIISYGSSATSLSIPDDNVYRMVPDTKEQGNAMANIIYSEGITTLIPIWRGDTWGDGLHDAIFTEFTRIGGTVDEGIRYFPETKTFPIETSFLADRVNHHINSIDAQNIGVMIIGFEEYVQIIHSASEYDILDDVRWFGSPGVARTSQMISEPILMDFADTTQFTAIQFAPSYSEQYDMVKSRIELDISRSPSVYAFTAYDSVWVTGLTILDTDSIDVITIKNRFPIIADSYTGVIGHTKLNDAGDLATGNYEIVGIKNDQWFLVGTYNTDSGIISKTG